MFVRKLPPLIFIFWICLNFAYAQKPELVVQSGHADSVPALSVSPDGKILASGGGSFTRTIKLWDIESGRELKTLSGHAGMLNTLAFSPDGKILASGGADNKIILWNTATGRMLKTLEGHTGQIRSVAFSPDGDILASGALENTIRLWNVESGKEIRSSMTHDGYVDGVFFGTDGKTLISVGSNDVKYWDVAAQNELRSVPIPAGFNRRVCFSPDGKILAWLASDEIKLFDIDSKKVLKTEMRHFSVSALAFNSDGSILASGGGDKTIKLWRLGLKREPDTINAHASTIDSLTFSPDGRLISGSLDKTIKIWDVSAKSKIRTLDAQTDPLWKVIVSPDGKTLASIGFDEAIRLWSLPKMSELRTIKGRTESNYVVYIHLVVFSPDSQTLASVGWDKSIGLWDVASGQKTRTLKNNRDILKGIAFSPDGKALALLSVSDKIKIWDIALDREIISPSLPDWTNALKSEMNANFAMTGKNFGANVRGNLILLQNTDQRTNPKDVASLISFNGDERDWLIVSPDGFFEGTPNSWEKVIWLRDGNIFDFAPVEAYFYEYYYPGLLQKLLAGDTPDLPQKSIRFEQKDTRQAEVSVCRKCPCTETDSVSKDESPAAAGESELCIDILASPVLTMADFTDFNGFADALANGKDAFSRQLFATFLPDSKAMLKSYVEKLKTAPAEEPDYILQQTIRREIGALLRRKDFFETNRSLVGRISDATLAFSKSNDGNGEIFWLNRMLLEDAFPKSIRPGKIYDLENTGEPASTSEGEIKCPKNAMCLQDMRLFWNGRLIRRWRGDILDNCRPVSRFRVQCETTVPVVGGIKNKYTAYLFNQDKVKSKNGELVIEVAGSEPGALSK